MTRLALIAALALATVAPAMAQSLTQNRIGQFTYYNGTTSDGQPITGTSNQIGQFRYDNWQTPQGSVNCTSNQIGQFTYTNCY